MANYHQQKLFDMEHDVLVDGMLLANTQHIGEIEDSLVANIYVLARTVF